LLYVLATLAAMAAIPALALWYSVVFPRQPFSGPLPRLDQETRALAARLKTHVRVIASRPRNLDHPAELEAAASYIERTLTDLGYRPGRQAYDVRGTSVRNIETVIDPAAADPDTPTYVIGAHYDSPAGSPGANDNGTGVAALIELARALRPATPMRHRLRLVFFVNEEHPYGKTPDMGSYRHAERLKKSGETVAGMMSLETIGYFSDQPGSQTFPAPFGLIYEDVGNFVAFVGLPRARAFVRRVLRSFRSHTQFPSIGGVAPAFVPGIDFSDHWSYDQFGFAAIMVTDTAPFRNPNYHKRGDLPDTVDYESLARVTKGIERVVRDLVSE